MIIRSSYWQIIFKKTDSYDYLQNSDLKKSSQLKSIKMHSL